MASSGRVQSGGMVLKNWWGNAPEKQGTQRGNATEKSQIEKAETP